MNLLKLKKLFFIYTILFCPLSIFAQYAGAPSAAPLPQEQANLPLKKASLFSSGVGYFEHQGAIPENASIVLPFNTNAVNDALKSLVINDSEAVAPQVNYLSETSLYRTLKSLKIDLSGSPTLADILRGLRGAEIELTASSSGTPIVGRIVSVENNILFNSKDDTNYNPALSISTSNGIRVINVSEIKSFNFSDPAINTDLNKALNIISKSRDEQSKQLQIDLSGRNKRNISVSYVIPTPVWKVSYRLDLNQSKPFLQGWAIIDNDGDTDWVNVELSLVTGRPVSFMQQLYSPYYTKRPTMPLSIAGIADARTYDSGYSDDSSVTYSQMAPVAPSPKAFSANSRGVLADSELSYSEPGMSGVVELVDRSWDSYGLTGGVSGGVMETARGANLGDQFEFTLKKPVTLARQQSAMLPLVEGSVLAEKKLVFQGQKATAGNSIHPAISAQLTNNTGMKLPAGPITVFDGGTYAGDALIEFVPENEKRIISYGADLSVSGTKISNNTSEVTTVNVNKGVMTINRKEIFENKYVIRNASGQKKKMLIEHPITTNTTLSDPKKPDEQTAKLYRFDLEIAANGVLNFTVREEKPGLQRIVLSNIPLDSFVYYSTSSDIPRNIRAALEKAVQLKTLSQNESKKLNDMQSDITKLSQEQDRIRKNIEAVGNTSERGLEYMKRLSEQDNQIDDLNARIKEQRTASANAQKAYDDYVGTLVL